MLKAFDIALLADVRSLPGSRKYPQFNKEELSASLAGAGIEYIHLPELGGRRKAAKDSHNTAWRNASFQGYADYMETADFEEGISRLCKLAEEKRACIMCAEAVWWRCHRSMVADFLKVRDWEVLHILSEKKVEEHPYTSPAKVINGQLHYDVE